MLFWTKEREAGVWGSKGRVDGSQREEREQMFGKQIPAGAAGKQWDTEAEPVQQLRGSFLSTPLAQVMLR